MTVDNSSHQDAFPRNDFDLYGRAGLLDTLAENEASRSEEITEPEPTPSVVQQLANTLDEQLKRNLPPEIFTWASNELAFATRMWGKYSEDFIGLPHPYFNQDDINNSPAIGYNLIPKLEQLYQAKQALGASGEQTLDGENIGDSMHLVLIPWQALRQNFHRLPYWLMEGRQYQPDIQGADRFNDELITTILSNQPLYRNPDNPSQLLTPYEYLDAQIEQDGPWGVMLIQTSNSPGVRTYYNKSPDELTNEGQDSLKMAGHVVDSLGIFEWLSLTLQETPTRFLDSSMLLANRLDDPQGDRTVVPISVAFTGSTFMWCAESRTNHHEEAIQPRLAVSYKER